MANGLVKMTRGDYHATADAIWLADAVDAKKAKTVLDAGIGTGAASLCLLARAKHLKITGLDNSEKMLVECEQNLKLNNADIELIRNDLFIWKTNRTFDVVMTNPPYFKGSARAGGMHHNADIFEWTRACGRRVRPRGYIYIIVDAAQTARVIQALDTFGNININPLFSNRDTAERVIVSARLGVKTGTTVHKGRNIVTSD